MHIVLLVVLALSGLVWGIVNLQREMRRRQWATKNTTPLYNIDKPRDLVATLAFALLKCGGDLTAEQKEGLIASYVNDLNYSEKQANEMYGYASYLVSTDPNYASKAKEIAAPALAKFNSAQRESALTLIQQLVAQPGKLQNDFLNDIRSIFAGPIS